MKIEICKISQDNYDDFLPFKMNGRPFSVFDIHFPGFTGVQMETIGVWMSKIDAFPIYLCLQITDSFTSVFESNCNENNLKFQYIGEYESSKVAILDILNRDSFSTIFPLIDLISSMEDLVLWSSKKNCFSVDPQIRQKGLFDLIPLNINFEEETIVFSLIQSGIVLEVFSKSSYLNSYEDIVKSLPEFLIPINSEE